MRSLPQKWYIISIFYKLFNLIEETIPEPREDYKPHVPRIVMITIPKDMIGAVIGPGGKIIQDIQACTNTTITIEEEDNVGKVSIASANKADVEAAIERINQIVAIPEVGKTYKGKVKSIVTFGAFIEILPGKDGLLHVSEMDWKRVEDPASVVKEGDEVEVLLKEIDEKTGKLRLSLRDLKEKPADYVEPQPRERGPRPDRGDRPQRDNRGPRHDRGDRPHRDDHGPRRDDRNDKQED